MNRILLLLPLFFAAACAHSTIVPFQTKDQPAPVYPATDPNSIGVFRSQRPFEKFTELGLIALRTTRLDLPLIYQTLREDAAPRGAEAVVDLKTHFETHTEMEFQSVCVPETVCSPGGACETRQICHDEPIPVSRTTFLTEGSMIRRKP